MSYELSAAALPPMNVLALSNTPGHSVGSSDAS
jgi:hypothetical protein